jgi:lipopolysaccharide/colanic/teichoic acid biosynthesis glycosyltransferase
MNQSAQHCDRGGADGFEELTPAQEFELTAHSSPYLVIKQLSPWSRSSTKRFFDCACVLLALPLLVPLFLSIALTVRLTSSGPVLFLQRRMGRHGRAFTILKFRTMIHAAHKVHHPVTTAYNQCFTPAGSFLRHWKLDELPQLLNVLRGDMSLVGPRPLMLEHVISNLKCRPGITGAATIAFALEEQVLESVPMRSLESCYHTVLLPAKHRLDAEYMARATFLSDLKLIVDSVLRLWNTSTMEGLLKTGALEAEDEILLSRISDPESVTTHVLMPPRTDRSASME